MLSARAAAVVGVLALALAVTVPPSGFGISGWSILPQLYWDFVSCDGTNEAIAAFCSSGDSPNCNRRYGEPNKWAYIACAAYDGNGGELLNEADVVTVPASNVNAFGSVAVCPPGRLITGICTSGANQDCRDASNNRVYTSLKCTAISDGLSLRSYTLAQALAAPDDWAAYSAQGPTINNLGGDSLQSNDFSQSTSVVCNSGYVAVGACTGGSNYLDCANFVTAEYASARAYLLCVPLPSSSPTPAPTSVPTTAAPTDPGETPPPTDAPTASTSSPTASPTPSTAPTPAPSPAPTPLPTSSPTTRTSTESDTDDVAVITVFAVLLAATIAVVIWSMKRDIRDRAYFNRR